MSILSLPLASRQAVLCFFKPTLHRFEKQLEKYQQFNAQPVRFFIGQVYIELLEINSFEFIYSFLAQFHSFSFSISGMGLGIVESSPHCFLDH